ncbi:MAG: hypothetical protein WC962_10420 [Phycisphaerae bacterium]|jgi:predicted amidophosphoribosyltransferase
MNAAHHMSRCAIFGHDWKRKRVSDDTTILACYHCHARYDPEILGSDVCPRCGRKMKHPAQFKTECIRCGSVK